MAFNEKANKRREQGHGYDHTFFSPKLKNKLNGTGKFFISSF
jgi:hypothetical protein